MRERGPILLAVGPTPDLAKRALTENGLSPDGGWPVLAGWQGAALEHVLLAQLAAGRLRLAQDADLKAFKEASSWSVEDRRKDEVVSKREGLSATLREGGRGA